MSLAVVVVVLPAMAAAQWTQMGSDIDGVAMFDSAGDAVAIGASGSVVAVGAYGHGIGPGHVRVYEWNAAATTWDQRGPDIDGEEDGDLFGSSVALSADGSRLAAGAPGYDGHDLGTGHTRVFEWNAGGGTWDQLGLDIDGESTLDGSGHSVALSADGSRLAIGALGNDGAGYERGHVRVHGWIDGAWVQRGSDIDGDADHDLFGYSVALSSDGSRLAIGAPGHDGISGDSGRVRVYKWFYATQNWIQLGPDIDGDAWNDDLGESVALSSDGSRLAVGAPGLDSGGASAGTARVYSWISPSWVQLGSDITGGHYLDNLGTSVALSSDGSLLAVGAPSASGHIDATPGHARVYEYTGPIGNMNWVQLGNDIAGEATADQSGKSVALSENGLRVAIGAPLNQTNGYRSGHVRVMEFSLFADGFESGDTTRWSGTVPRSVRATAERSYSARIRTSPLERSRAAASPP